LGNNSLIINFKGNASGDNDIKLILNAVRIALLPFEFIWLNVRKFVEEKSLLSIQDMSTISLAKAKLTAHNPEIRSRAFCLPGVDVVAIKGKNQLSTRVIRGKVGDLGDEANNVELDLGLPYFLNFISILFSTSTKSRYAFKLEISVDGKKWQLLYDFTKYHTSNKVDLAFDGRVVRYIRISEGLYCSSIV
jgi:hypothetical protein